MALPVLGWTDATNMAYNSSYSLYQNNGKEYFSFLNIPGDKVLRSASGATFS
jgi:hypothetical protein